MHPIVPGETNLSPGHAFNEDDTQGIDSLMRMAGIEAMEAGARNGGEAGGRSAGGSEARQGVERERAAAWRWRSGQQQCGIGRACMQRSGGFRVEAGRAVAARWKEGAGRCECTHNKDAESTEAQRRCDAAA